PGRRRTDVLHHITLGDFHIRIIDLDSAGGRSVHQDKDHRDNHRGCYTTDDHLQLLLLLFLSLRSIPAAGAARARFCLGLWRCRFCLVRLIRLLLLILLLLRSRLAGIASFTFVGFSVARILTHCSRTPDSGDIRRTKISVWPSLLVAHAPCEHA